VIVAVEHAQADGLLFADDAVARRLDQLQPAVALALVAGDERLKRRVMPSVTRIAPPTRSGGVSASAVRSAANSSVPLLSGSSRGVSTKRASTFSIAASWRAISALAASVCGARSPMRLEAERSSTTATTSFSGRRSSRFNAGSASANRMSAATIVRANAARGRRQAVRATAATASPAKTP
jgi:hypothetical protein